MAMAPQVIELTAGLAGQSIHSEKAAASGTAIIAGMLLEIASAEVQEHSTAAGTASKTFALPNICTGGTIDTVYEVGDLVRYGTFSAGQMINALVANGASAIAEGDALESAGNGTLRKVATAAATANTSRSSIVGFASEAVDNSGGSKAARIAVIAA